MGMGMGHPYSLRLRPGKAAETYWPAELRYRMSTGTWRGCPSEKQKGLDGAKAVAAPWGLQCIRAKAHGHSLLSYLFPQKHQSISEP